MPREESAETQDASRRTWLHASFDLLLAGFGATLGIATALLIAFA